MLDIFGICAIFLDMEPQRIRPLSSSFFLPASVLFNGICNKGMIGSRPGFNPWYQQHFQKGFFKIKVLWKNSIGLCQ
jgi:hypothetical protein